MCVKVFYDLVFQNETPCFFYKNCFFIKFMIYLPGHLRMHQLGLFLKTPHPTGTKS